jgi:hypothetical protein
MPRLSRADQRAGRAGLPAEPLVHSLHKCLPQPMMAQPFSLICADVFKVATVSLSILLHPEQDTVMVSEAIAAGAGRAVLRGSSHAVKL